MSKVCSSDLPFRKYVSSTRHCDIHVVKNERVFVVMRSGTKLRKGLGVKSIPCALPYICRRRVGHRVASALPPIAVVGPPVPLIAIPVINAVVVNELVLGPPSPVGAFRMRVSKVLVSLHVVIMFRKADCMQFSKIHGTARVSVHFSRFIGLRLPDSLFYDPHILLPVAQRALLFGGACVLLGAVGSHFATGRRKRPLRLSLRSFFRRLGDLIQRADALSIVLSICDLWLVAAP